MTNELKIEIENTLTHIDLPAYKIGFCGPNECEQAFDLAQQIREVVKVAKERLDKELK